MTYSKMILDLLNSLINSDKFPIKSNKKTKGLFKNLNNFNEIKLLINRYIFKNKYSKTIF
mgnify:FL=1|jgi:hypothetical protein